MQDPCLIEEMVPGVALLFLQRPLLLIHDLIETAGLDTILDRPDFVGRRPVEMRQEHCIGRAVPDFLRTDKENILGRITVDIQEELCCIDDLVDRGERVPAADHREERDGVENEQEGTGHTEEIPHHQIRRPGRLQIGEAVKNIESVAAFPLNDSVDLDREGLEPVRKLDIDPLDLRTFGDQLRMRSKTEIDDIAAVAFSLLNERIRETAEIIEI